MPKPIPAAVTEPNGTVSDEQAQQVLEAIVAQYVAYFEPIMKGDTEQVLCPPSPLPVIRRDEDGHAVIWWEEGPSSWAFQVTEGGSTEEDRALAAQVSAEFGSRLVAAEPEPVQFPPDVRVEPHTSFAVGVYPA